MNTILNEYNLPENLTPESVFYSLDGPIEQKIRDLKRIKCLCEGIESIEYLKDAIRSNRKNTYLLGGVYGFRVCFGDIDEYLTKLEEENCEHSNDPKIAEQARTTFYSYDIVSIEKMTWNNIVKKLRSI